MDHVRGEGLYVGDGADTLTNPKSRSSRVLRIDPDTGAARVLATGMGAPIGVLRHGRWLYVADGLEGRILRMRPDGSASRVITRSRLLRPAPESPYGANGLAVDPAGRTLYVPNPGTGRILSVGLGDVGGGPRTRVFADGERINRRQDTQYALAGPDDVAVDARGNLWITANDAEEIQALSPTGRLIARVRGLGVDATRNPTALAFRGRQLLITNFDARSATPGANSKLSVVRTPFAGLGRVAR
jgi:sugar lactone lactonase YvrE